MLDPGRLQVAPLLCMGMACGDRRLAEVTMNGGSRGSFTRRCVAVWAQSGRSLRRCTGDQGAHPARPPRTPA